MINAKELVVFRLRESSEVTFLTADVCVQDIVLAAEKIFQSIRNGGKLLLCGNGGSAADCQHMAAELVCRLTSEFNRPGIPAIALTTDTSFLTAYSNDFSFEGIYERQIEALGKPGDVLIAISTSGNSKNILKAVETAKKEGIEVIVLCGEEGKIINQAPVSIKIPSKVTQKIQETQLVVEHILCELVEHMLFDQEMATAI